MVESHLSFIHITPFKVKSLQRYFIIILYTISFLLVRQNAYYIPLFFKIESCLLSISFCIQFFFPVLGNAYYIVLFVNNSTLSNVDMDIWDFTGQHLYYVRPFVADVTLALSDYV